MCGICGFITNQNININTLISMNDTLVHRGPDDHGEEIYQMKGGKYVGFAQRRLSIIDLSEKGHQPMHSANKRVSVIFNGEIYNHQELRNEIKEYPFVSDCDTEVIIAAYLKWGVDFLNKINGMFAIALLDRETDSVYLIRDRIGKKPLFYYVDNENNLVFASELKAIVHSGLLKQEINQDVIGRFLYRSYIIAPDTIYQNTYKLEAGSVLEIAGDSIRKYKYWDVAVKYNELKNSSIVGYQQAKSELKELLRKAVAKRMIADVPVGAFLSGGYDSSLVCAIAQELSAKPIKTYSIGFDDEKLNEAGYAKQVARALGTDHKELYIDEQDMLEMVASIPHYYDEPFADSSQIPTMLVSRLAKEKVSVVLSGDGGDELFGGYNIYTVLQQAQKRKSIGRALYEIGRIQGMRQTALWKKRSIIYRILSDDNNPEARTQSGVNTYFEAINQIMPQPINNFYYEFESKYHEKRYDATRMLLDMDTYLPDDILIKVDRASMKYALECRCPILDKDVIEYSFKLPLKYKIYHRNKKRILKDIAYDYIPKELLDRPKAGFSVPLDKWLRGVLKEQIMDWTSRDYLIKQGIFEPDNTIVFINTYMKNGDIGKWSGQNFSKIVWAYFVFQQWYQEYGNRNMKGENQEMRYEELEKLRNEYGGGYKLCLFGAGLIGCTWAYDLLSVMGFHIDFYCDNNKEENIEIQEGIKTISLETLYSMKDKVLVFVTVAEKYQDSIRIQLEENGICSIVRVDEPFLQVFIESLIEMDNPDICARFKYILNDAEYICRQFKYQFGYELDLKNPKTYNEKINWEKLNNRDERKTRLADKYLVKEWVKEQIGEEHLTKLYGVWDDADDINFDTLPDGFVLKTNNGSSRNIIVKDKTQINQADVRRQLNEWKDSNFAYFTREFQYKDIIPKIICEEYLEGVADNVYDYNIYCFHGEPVYIWCIKESHKPNCRASFYNKEWEMQPFSYGYPKDNVLAPKPEKLEEMLELSRILCKDFRHVRVDWYNLPDGRVLFGEMTFSTWAGFRRFEPEEYDTIWGKLI